MVRVIILSRNSLSSEKFATKLRMLNYEVLCSTTIFDALLKQKKVGDFLAYFPIIVVDTTVSNSEMERILRQIRNDRQSIVRIVEHISEESAEVDLKERDSFYYLLSEDSKESVRDRFAELANKHVSFDLELNGSIGEENETGKDMAFISLSALERRVFRILSNYSGETVSREYICTELWGEASNSRLSQLSMLIGNIRKKFGRYILDEEIIQSFWKKGYRMNPLFAC